MKYRNGVIPLKYYNDFQEVPAMSLKTIPNEEVQYIFGGVLFETLLYS